MQSARDGAPRSIRPRDELEDKTWFIILLVLGLLSFGAVAMIIYVSEVFSRAPIHDTRPPMNPAIIASAATTNGRRSPGR